MMRARLIALAIVLGLGSQAAAEEQLSKQEITDLLVGKHFFYLSTWATFNVMLHPEGTFFITTDLRRGSGSAPSSGTFKIDDGKICFSGTFNMCKVIVRDGKIVKVYDMGGSYRDQRHYIIVE